MENDTKFTPGPWSLKPCETFDGRATYSYYEVWTDDCDVICEEVYRAHNDGGRANMLLIAAAPELYQALESAMDEINQMEPTPSLVAVALSARAALAKARGEKS